MKIGKERECVGTFPKGLENTQFNSLTFYGNKPNITSIGESSKIKDFWGKNISYELKGKMSLLDETSTKIKNEWNTDSGSIFSLVENAADMELYAYNDGKASPLTDWSYIKWSTCLYSFKSKKFSCSEIRYNDDTGRIDGITFEEYRK